MRGRIASMVAGLGVLSCFSVHSMSNEGIARSLEGARTYVFLCSGVNDINGEEEGSIRRAEADFLGLANNPGRLSIGAVTVDEGLNIVWGAEISFRTVEHGSSMEYKFSLNIREEYEKYGDVTGDAERDHRLFRYENSQEERFFHDSLREVWRIEDKPEYLHNYGKNGRPKELYPETPDIDWTIIDMLRRSYVSWTHNGALSIGGFLEILGQCGCEESYMESFFHWKKYRMAPKKKVDFHKSFLRNARIGRAEFDQSLHDFQEVFWQWVLGDVD